MASIKVEAQLNLEAQLECFGIGNFLLLSSDLTHADTRLR